MRTVIVLLLGVGLLAAFVFIASFKGGKHAQIKAAYTFLVAWLLFCIADWAYGVFAAGYPAIDELGIHTLLFGLPAVAAVLLIWKFRQAT